MKRHGTWHFEVIYKSWVLHVHEVITNYWLLVLAGNLLKWQTQKTEYIIWFWCHLHHHERERESRVEKREKVLVIFALCNHHLFFVAFDFNNSAWFLNECRHQHMVLNHLHLVFLFLICFDYWSEYCVSESWLINLAFWNRTGSWGEFDQLYKGQVHNTNL